MQVSIPQHNLALGSPGLTNFQACNRPNLPDGDGVQFLLPVNKMHMTDTSVVYMIDEENNLF